MYAVVDIESTGLIPGRNEILSLAAIILDNELNEVSCFNSNIRPNYWNFWTEEAFEVHRITKAKAFGFKSQEEVLTEFIEFLSAFQTRFTMVCHAMPFTSSIDLIDRNFIFYWFDYQDKRFEYYKLFDDEGTLSTINRKRSYATDLYGIANQKLSTWMDKLGIDKSGHHASLSDARACAQVFRFQKTFMGTLHGENRVNGLSGFKAKDDKIRCLEEEKMCC